MTDDITGPDRPRTTEITHGASSWPPIRIAHVIVGLKASGAETALLRLVQQSPPGFRHAVVSLTDRGDLADAFEAAGAEVLTLGIRGVRAPVRAVAGMIRMAMGLKPQVVQGWMVHGNIAAWLFRLLCFPGARLAWNLRVTTADAVHEKTGTRLATQWAAVLSRSVDLLISNSEAGLRDHRALGYRARNEAIIPNGFDLSVFRPDPDDRRRIREEWKLSPEAVVFALVGRYHNQKGHSVFIQAAAIVQDACPEATFVLVGREADESNRALVDSLIARGLGSRFLLLGARSDVPEILRAVDVLCMPSNYEGFPNVLGEAMASALPCIATDVSDVARILGHSGRLIRVADVAGLAASMIEMCALGPTGRTEMGIKARQRIADRYTLEMVAQLYRDKYLELGGR